MEWLILLLLVPFVVAPAVLLWGFAGCDVFWGLEPRPPAVLPPDEVKAHTLSRRSIRVSWTNPNPGKTRFRVERLRDGEDTPHPFYAPDETLTIDDDGLEAGTTYFYEVYAIRDSDHEESATPGSAEATTLAWTEAFRTALSISQPDLHGYCIIQRIEPLLLHASGGEIRLTLHGSALGMLHIDKITISRALTPAPGDMFGNLYDADEEPTYVAGGVKIPADAIVPLSPIAYNLDHMRPLLIAFDINPTPGKGNVRRRADVESDEASMFFKAAHADAGVADRVPTPTVPNEVYSPSDSIYIVEKIEVVPHAQ